MMPSTKPLMVDNFHLLVSESFECRRFVGARLVGGARNWQGCGVVVADDDAERGVEGEGGQQECCGVEVKGVHAATHSGAGGAHTRPNVQ